MSKCKNVKEDNTQLKARYTIPSSPYIQYHKLMTCMSFILHSQITAPFVFIAYEHCSSSLAIIAAEFWA